MIFMAASLLQFHQYLTQYNCQHFLFEDYNIIVVPIQAENQDNLLVFISLQQDGRYFEISAEKLLTVDNSGDREKLFETLLTLSWEHGLLCKYNPEYGEISASCEFPLEDNNLTESQFHTCFYDFIDKIDFNIIPTLRSVVAGEEYLNESQSIKQLKLDLENFYRF